MTNLIAQSHCGGPPAVGGPRGQIGQLFNRLVKKSERVLETSKRAVVLCNLFVRLALTYSLLSVTALIMPIVNDTTKIMVNSTIIDLRKFHASNRLCNSCLLGFRHCRSLHLLQLRLRQEKRIPPRHRFDLIKANHVRCPSPRQAFQL